MRVIPVSRHLLSRPTPRLVERHDSLCAHCARDVVADGLEQARQRGFGGLALLAAVVGGCVAVHRRKQMAASPLSHSRSYFVLRTAVRASEALTAAPSAEQKRELVPLLCVIAVCAVAVFACPRSRRRMLRRIIIFNFKKRK